MAYKKHISNWFSTDMIVRNTVVAALYFVLTLISYPIAYGMFQFRISEILNLLVFFNPAYTIGLTLGCFLANTVSPMPWDMLIGTGATLVGALLMMPFRQLFIAGLMPCLVNSLVIGAELYYLMGLGPSTPYWACFGWVLLGEIAAIDGLGYILFMLLGHYYKPVIKLFNATRNTDFVW